MSLTPTDDELETWMGVLERRFIAAAQTEAAYADAARIAHRQAVEWIFHDSEIPGGFCWTCALLGLEPDAVRRELGKHAEADLTALREMM